MINRRGFLGALLAVAAAPSLAGFTSAPVAQACQFVNVLNFGADPAGRMGSASAFRRAAAAAKGHEHGVVYVPSGTYSMNEVFTLDSRVHLVGDVREAKPVMKYQSICWGA